jgi:hypothetical protein
MDSILPSEGNGSSSTLDRASITRYPRPEFAEKMKRYVDRMDWHSPSRSHLWDFVPIPVWGNMGLIHPKDTRIFADFGDGRDAEMDAYKVGYRHAFDWGQSTTVFYRLFGDEVVFCCFD